MLSRASKILTVNEALQHIVMHIIETVSDVFLYV